MSREEVCSTLDGNAAGGLLREVFAFDATAARTTCAGCATVVLIGELRLYASSWALSCAAPHAMRPWYGLPARHGGSGSTCGARQPS
jgi:hypothetical protein